MRSSHDHLSAESAARLVTPKFWILPAVMLLAAVLARLGGAAEPAVNIKVAAVQMRSSKNLDENIERTIEFIRRCANKGARIVVFPECSVTGYFVDAIKETTSEQLVEAEKRIAAASKKYDVYTIIGMPWRENGKLFNSAIMISPKGTVIERYHKVQLAKPAETWPDPGDHLSVYKMDDVMCTTMICHDERYPEIVRLPVIVGAQIVFYISHESDIKYESKVGPYRAQIQARAVENCVWVIQANAPANEDTTGSHGHSRIIAPDGNILKEATIFGEDIIMATIDVSRATREYACRSPQSEVLRDWWQEGLKRVRVIE